MRCIMRIGISPNPETGRRRTRGWQVRVIRRGIAINEFFSDAKFGGRAGALSEAMFFRDRVMAELTIIPRSEIARRRTPRNTSGIVGVRHHLKPVKKADGKIYEYEVWTAAGSPEPGKRKVRSFYVSKLGADEAREAAIAQRMRWEKQMARVERESLPRARAR